MKRTFLLCDAAAVCLLLFAACVPVPDDDDLDPRLAGKWANTLSGDTSADGAKALTVNANFTFACNINPSGQGRANIKGRIEFISGDTYMIDELLPATPADAAFGWTNLAFAYNGQYVRIIFDSQHSFEFISATGNQDVTTNFGGKYYRLP